MKYSILGFNQERVMNTDLDLTDLMLLQYILTACGSPKMKHILDGDEYPLVWIQHKKLSEDLPILRISEGTLRNRLNQLKNSGYIVSKTIATENLRGTRTYYGLTELTTSLIYDENDTSTSRKNDVVSGARHVKMTSDNTVNNNSKVSNTIPNGIVRENPTTEETSSDNVSDYERHMYTDEKPKKKSRWDKCAEMVDEYTDDEELRGVLKSYLSDRLAMRDKPIYPNQWKALLKKLTAIGGNTKAIVQQSIEYGYASFYPLHNKSRITSTPLSNFGESEVNQTIKVTKEQREAMLRNGEVY